MDAVAQLRRSLFLALGLSLLGCGDKEDPPAVAAPDTSAADSASPADSGSGNSTVPPGVCDNEEPVTQWDGTSDIPTGYYRCEPEKNHVFWHRREVVPAEHPEGLVGTCGDYPSAENLCQNDCSDEPYGYCNLVYSDSEFCDCSFGCATDSDCASDEVCRPAGARSACIRAFCKTDEDCGDGLCQAAPYNTDICGNSAWEQACQTANDECRSSFDCRAAFPDEDNPECRYSREEQRFVCDEGLSGSCGRLFTMEGGHRTAALTPGGGWSRARKRLAVPAHQRAALAAWWRHCGLLEHASVASFSRFSLELLHLGAPPELLVEAQQAGLDEVRHARLCFGLATEIDGEEAGPGALDVTGALSGGLTREAILRRLVSEACVGETLAALEAAAARDAADDGAVRAILTEIAADEARHAAMGWRALRWMLAQGDAALRDAARQAFEAAIVAARVPGERPAGLDALGVLGSEAYGAVVHRGVGEVIVPMAASVLRSQGALSPPITSMSAPTL